MKNKLVSFIFGLILILIITVLSFFIGRMTAHFDDNMCYGDILISVTNQLQNPSKQHIHTLHQKLQKLPLHGYESDCEKIHHSFLNN